MSEMIERVARAIDPGSFPEEGDPNLCWCPQCREEVASWQEAAIERVRKTIEAMREPTADMLCRAIPIPLHLVIERADEKYTAAMETATMTDRIIARQIYQALIDAALSSPNTEVQK